jgi:GR25 family glycosyltransferase involved in LPS biosynthesis
MTIVFEFDEKNTFCISVNEDRYTKMKRRFEKIDLKVSRWNASFPNTLIDNFSNSLKPLQKACTQSHINIWRHIIAENLPYGFILEDDACFDKNWKTKLEELDREEFDAIFLNASEPMTPAFKWDIASEQYLCGGYILSREGAQWLIDNYQDHFFMSDWMTSRLQTRGKSYSFFPWLIIQEGRDTTIGSNIDLDHKKVINCLNEIDYSLSNYDI